jgi:hypothetical protein
MKSGSWEVIHPGALNAHNYCNYAVAASLALVAMPGAVDWDTAVALEYAIERTGKYRLMLLLFKKVVNSSCGPNA